jgi:hypothetical protein
MNKKIILLSALAMSIASAGYMVQFPLDPKYINLDTPDEITGVIELAPATINRGESTALNWNYNYIKSLKVVSSDQNFNETASFGSYPLSPLKTTNYDITLDNNKKIEEKTLKLTVIQPNPVVNFTADKTKIGEGQSSKLTWNVSDAESALLENTGISGLNSSYTVSPVNDTTYKLNVTGYNNENNTSKSISIDVVKDSTIGSFQSDKTKVSIGDDITFNWTTNDSEGLELIPFGIVDKTSTSKAVTMGTVGDFTYSLKTTSFSGMTKTSNPIAVSVYGLPTITSYKVNNSDTSVTVEANDPLAFTWAGANNVSYDINGVVVSNGTYTLNADTSTGTKNYVLTGVNGAGKTINKSVSVNVVGTGNIPSFSTVSTTFANTPIVLNWTGSNISNYKLSGVAGSGVTGSQDLGTDLTYTATPTSVGSLEYTLTGTNAASKTTVKKTSVVVEADPTMSSMTVNGQSSVSVSPNQALSFVGTGLSNGATLIGKTSSGTASALPSTASATIGTATYYGAGSKTINGVTRDSALKSVTVTTVDYPKMSGLNRPAAVFVNEPINTNWTGTNVSKYTLYGDVAASGVSPSGVDLGTSTSYSTSSNTAGTYAYKLVATNMAGATLDADYTVIVENIPTLGGFTVNGSTAISVAPNTALSFVGSGISSGAIGQARTNGNDGNLTFPATAPSTAGTYTYYMAAAKTLNGVNKYSPLRSVTVSVVNAPTIGTISAPTVINYGSAFTLSWSGTDVANYTVKGNVAASGVAVAGVSTGTGAALSVTPQAAGTYNYTVTATNSIGAATAKVSGNVKVEQWVAIAPTYTGWVNSSGFYSCSAFSPDASTVNAGTGFYQTQYCYLNQSRTRQDRIQEVATGEVRNTTAVGESQTLTNQPNTQYAVGTKPTTTCRYDASNYWVVVVFQGGNTGAQVVWDGGSKATSTAFPGAVNITQMAGWDGYTYTKGAQVSSLRWYACRNG